MAYKTLQQLKKEKKMLVNKKAVEKDFSKRNAEARKLRREIRQLKYPRATKAGRFIKFVGIRAGQGSANITEKLFKK